MNIKITGSKQIQIQLDKDQSKMIAMVAIATVITIFSLVSTRALISQAAYQRRVINARNATIHQIQLNSTNADTLIKQFNDVFEGNNAQNVIGGKNTTDPNSKPPDGDNARVVLDALPTTYDFPALLTSVSSILTNNGIGSPSIGGTDQSTTFNSSPSATPKSVPIDLSVTGSGNYENVQALVKDIERSVRPFNVTRMTLSGNQSNLVLSLNMTTYYQVAKTLNTTSKEIK